MEPPTTSDMQATNADNSTLRKRRNRWGDAENDSSNQAPEVNSNSLNSEVGETDEGTKKARRSRWGSAAAEVDSSHNASTIPISACIPIGASNNLPLLPVLSEEVIQQTLVLQLQLQQVNQKTLTVVRDALLIEQDPNRSPSPPPRYDSNGKRTNTREVRMREALAAERINIIEQLIKINPTFQPPSDFTRLKPTKKLYLPKVTDPNMNYIGLIIGPRGMTQKELETETSTKISIRGKGSAKEGSKGRTAKNVDDDDELHVHIQGETMENVEKAIIKIQEIIQPKDDTINDHKQKQLKQLALINGTLRENEYCPVCGEKGHQQFDCPYRAKTFKAAGVKCSICGDLSHPTRDCPNKVEGPTNESVLESEYDNFLALLDGKPSSTKAAIEEGGAGAEVSGTGSSQAQQKSTKTGAQTVLAPIVDFFGNGPKKAQTIMVAPLMTGEMPPMLMATTAPSSAEDGSVSVSSYAYPAGAGVTPVAAAPHLAAMPPMPYPGMHPGYYPVPSPSFHAPSAQYPPQSHNYYGYQSMDPTTASYNYPVPPYGYAPPLPTAPAPPPAPPIPGPPPPGA